MANRHYLSACLCFKDSADYLSEWLAFYVGLGVEHFYLYNNGSTLGFGAVLAPYLDSGMVTLVQFPGAGQQHDMYAHCLDSFRRTTRWLMFCDDDEFLFPVADESLPAALERYEPYAGLAVSWMLYGSAGHVTRPTGLVIENYCRRAAVPDVHVKCIVNPRRVVRPLVIGHHFECMPNEAIVDEQGRPMTGPFRAQPSADRFRVNHYLTKSRAEMLERRQRIQANTGLVSPHSLERWIELESTWNAVHDPIAMRYAARVRARQMEMHGAREGCARVD
jgi:hypothetical protein